MSEKDRTTQPSHEPSLINRFVRKIGKTIILGTLIATIYLGSGNPTIIGAAQKVSTWGTIAHSRIERTIATILGEEYFLRRNARQTITHLQKEIERLQWLEAESAAQAHRLDAILADLQTDQEEIRHSLQLLAGWIEAGQPVQVDATTYQITEIEEFAIQEMQSLTALEEQILLYRQTQQMHEDAAHRGRLLWNEAQQNIDTTGAYLALMEASFSYRETGTTDMETPIGTGEMARGLQTYIERNKRIIQRRRQLEAELPTTEMALEVRRQKKDSKLWHSLNELQSSSSK